MLILVLSPLSLSDSTWMLHVSYTRKRHANKAAVTSPHFRLPVRTFAVEDWVDDVDAAEAVDEAVEPALPLPLLLLPGRAAPTGRIKPPSTPGGDVLEPVLAAAAL
jgi:hypothetical protein